MTAEAIKTLFEVPSEVLTNLTSVGTGIATGFVNGGWKVIAIGAVVWGGKYLVKGLLRLFKSAAH